MRSGRAAAAWAGGAPVSRASRSAIASAPRCGDCSPRERAMTITSIASARRPERPVAGKRTPIPSLHERILGDIEARILSGEWPPGARIPFEHELSAQYDCSRMTVNKALTQLAKAGLIERRRKVGSFVMRAPSRSAALEILDIRSEVAALGATYRYEILARLRRPAAPADAARRCSTSRQGRRAPRSTG